jgi:hypothetical protein
MLTAHCGHCLQLKSHIATKHYSILQCAFSSQEYVCKLKGKFVWNGVHSASRVQLRCYLEENVAAPV